MIFYLIFALLLFFVLVDPYGLTYVHLISAIAFQEVRRAVLRVRLWFALYPPLLWYRFKYRRLIRELQEGHKR